MPTLRARAGRLWARHRTLFWILHSGWALATGVAVIILARERYGFVPWVVVFLCLTWASTMYFGRSTSTDAAADAKEDAEEEAAKKARKDAGEQGSVDGGATASEPREEPDPVHASKELPAGPPLAHEVSSYVTRTMYQETLFFLLPFYAYSTVFRSLNVVFLLLLAGLAILSCLDLLFDRWLRNSPVFGLIFFASVAFAAANLVVPMLLSLPPRFSTPLAGVVAVAAAMPLALRAAGGTQGHWIRIGLAVAAILGLSVGAPQLVPPVPLRLQDAVFAPSIVREHLAVADTLSGTIRRPDAPDGLVVLARVFAPSALPTVVVVEWQHEGRTVRTSRPVEVTAHDEGFRVWDALRPSQHVLEPGTYRVVLRTRQGRVFGVEEIVVSE